MEKEMIRDGQWRTKDGRKARVAGRIDGGYWAGVVENGDGHPVSGLTWRADGSHYEDGCCLVGPWVDPLRCERELWVSFEDLRIGTTEFFEYILPPGASLWNRERTETCNRKFRVMVEEILE